MWGDDRGNLKLTFELGNTETVPVIQMGLNLVY